MTNSEHTLISSGKNRNPNQPEHFYAWSLRGLITSFSNGVFHWSSAMCSGTITERFPFIVWPRVIAMVSLSLRWVIILLIFFKIGNNNYTVPQAIEYGRNFDIFPFKILVSPRKLKRGRAKPRPRQHETNTRAFNAIP